MGSRAVERRTTADVLGGLIRHSHFTTAVIMVINLGLYLATAFYSMRAVHGGGFDVDNRTLVDFGAKFEVFALGQYWRLITAGFLHGGLMHILA